MVRLLIGGSPCTYWSIAQKNNRETKAEGEGWELFKNYLLAKEKFSPDLFLYENNKSASGAIKQQIREELQVYDGTLLMQDSGNRYIEIDSALVSAQHRERFYVHNCGEVEQPKDRGILLRDILEGGVPYQDKSHCVTGNYGGACLWNSLERHQRSMIAEPVRAGATPKPNGELSDSQSGRIYAIDGKSVTLSSGGGGAGAKTGLYAVPVTPCGTRQTDKARCLRAGYATASQRDLLEDIKTNGQLGTTGVIEEIGYATPIEWNDQGEPTKAVSGTDGKIYTVYKVVNGYITIRGGALSDKAKRRILYYPQTYCKRVLSFANNARRLLQSSIGHASV